MYLSNLNGLAARQAQTMAHVTEVPYCPGRGRTGSHEYVLYRVAYPGMIAPVSQSTSGMCSWPGGRRWSMSSWRIHFSWPACTGAA